MSTIVNGNTVIVNGISLSKDWESVLQQTGMTWEQLVDTLEDCRKAEEEAAMLADIMEAEEEERLREEEEAKRRHKAALKYVDYDAYEQSPDDFREVTYLSAPVNRHVPNPFDMEDLPF